MSWDEPPELDTPETDPSVFFRCDDCGWVGNDPKVTPITTSVEPRGEVAIYSEPEITCPRCGEDVNQTELTDEDCNDDAA